MREPERRVKQSGDTLPIGSLKGEAVSDGIRYSNKSRGESRG
jgi:hypothetical protein